MNEKSWPSLGSKVTFKGTKQPFWFTNILNDANELLEVGEEYTISKLELASSWCAVILEEFPEKKFSISWFDYEKELTTEEAMKVERAAWDTVKYEFTSLKELRDRKNNKLTIECRPNPDTVWYKVGTLDNATFQQAESFIENARKTNSNTPSYEYRIV